MLEFQSSIGFSTIDRLVEYCVYNNAWALAIILALILSACGDGTVLSPTEQRERIQQLIDDGDFQGALQNSAILVRQQPDDPEQSRFHGRVLLQAGQGWQAEAAFLRAEYLGLQRNHLLLDLGKALILQEKYRQALRILQASGEDPKASPELLALIGEAELEITSYNQKRVFETFLRLYKTLGNGLPGTNNANRMKIWLDTQRIGHPVVEAAFQHFSCSRQPVGGYNPIDSQNDRGTTEASVLRVGPERRLKMPSAAAREAQDGDIVEIDAGVYVDDVATWTQNNLVLRGVGGLAHMQSNGATAENKGIWLFEGNDNTVEWIEFSGARSTHHNGSGIRLHGSGLTVRFSYFHDNEDGILGGRGEDSDVLIEYSEFSRNGYGDGLSHNIYIGEARTLTFRYNYSHHANVGHLVKSRAQTNFILYNRLTDEDSGNSSYVIDIPEGGSAYIIGNELHKGPLSVNRTIISFGAEKQDRIHQVLYIFHNTFHNQSIKTVFVKNYTDADALLLNNLFAGAPGVMLKGSGRIDGFLTEGMLGLADPQAYDYSLSRDSPAIDAGVAIPQIEGIDVIPGAEYVHRANARQRLAVWTPDIGAHEFCGL